MFERYGVIEGTLHPLNISRVHELPDSLRDSASLEEKLQRDQRKLLSLVEFARTEDDRREFLYDYFH